MTEPVSQPIFFVVDEDPSAVETLVGDLERRFHADYRVMGETSAQAALERLGALRESGEQVALIICYESMRAMAGSELLARSRASHPDAKRILLIDHGDPRMLEVIAHGMAVGHVEYYLTKPWRPRQHWLYPVVGEAVVAWTRLNSPGFALVRIVGDHWDPVSFELRDALSSGLLPNYSVLRSRRRLRRRWPGVSARALPLSGSPGARRAAPARARRSARLTPDAAPVP